MNSKLISSEEKDNKINQRKKFIPSYGRKKSRSLNLLQKKAMTQIFPKIAIEASDEYIKDFVSKNKSKKINLEIGFGGGEHLLYQAKNNPNSIFIGSEVYINSFANLVYKIYKEKIDNIYLFNQDVRILLEKFPENFIDKIYILFPDPWPKQKQFKRRIVNLQTLELIYNPLKKGGVIRLATDIDSYFTQMLDVFNKYKKFSLITDEVDFTKQPSDHIITKYQNKAIEENRVSRFIEFQK
jgi:tRNA (guanine-N(7)-)-methyltransferase